MAKLNIKTKEEKELEKVADELVPNDRELEDAELEVKILNILMEVM